MGCPLWWRLPLDRLGLSRSCRQAIGLAMSGDKSPGHQRQSGDGPKKYRQGGEKAAQGFPPETDDAAALHRQMTKLIHVAQQNTAAPFRTSDITTLDLIRKERSCNVADLLFIRSDKTILFQSQEQATLSPLSKVGTCKLLDQVPALSVGFDRSKKISLVSSLHPSGLLFPTDTPSWWALC